ncbi:MAG: ribosome-binding factor A [Elusimicrobia bacterium GWA2_69_24]|nr:MAG: ribosome-binding factor A [Elusimicrobia bacterium GWA2_69_24]HBL18342.1 30S ribosome-binding factor RbfA [Elusimicrobiota bacterium]
MGFSRGTRLRELFFHEICQALSAIKDPGLRGFVTVTDMTLAADRKTAKVFYSLLGNQMDRENTQRALERAEGFFRSQLYSKLKVKYVPRLQFIFDETPSSAQRIETLLTKLNQDAPQAPPPAGPETELPALSAAGEPPRSEDGGPSAAEDPGAGVERLNLLGSRASRSRRYRRKRRPS